MVFKKITKKLKQTFFAKDSFINAQSSIGINSRASGFQWNSFFSESLTKEKLQDLYRKEGISKKIIDSYVKEAMRSFIDAETEVMFELERLKVRDKIFTACIESRLFGGSLIVAFVDDGRDLTEPLDLKSVTKLVSLKVFDKFQVSFDQDDIITDVLDEDYGMPELYKVMNYTLVASSQTFFKVHKSRVFKVDGEQTTENLRQKNGGWGDSCLQPIFEKIKRFEQTAGVTAEIVQGYVESVMKITDLSSKLVVDQSYLAQRAKTLDITKSATKTIFLDQHEDYQKLASNVSGLADLWDRFAEVVASVSSIPVSILFGRSPGGLNSNGQSELESWYNQVEEYRNFRLKPIFNFIFAILKAQKGFKDSGLHFHWDFHPLLTLDEKKESETRKISSEIDKLYVELGAVDAKTLFLKRYEKGSYNNNILFSKEDLANLLKTQEESEKITEEDIALLKEIEQEKEKKTKQEAQQAEQKIVQDKLDDYILKKIEAWK